MCRRQGKEVEGVEGVVASGVDPPAPVPGVLGEAGASTEAREALGTRGEHQEEHHAWDRGHTRAGSSN